MYNYIKGVLILGKIIELLFINIQVVGIFIAIIAGLVASKILSLNTEKDELSMKIEDVDSEIAVVKKRLIQKENKI